MKYLQLYDHLGNLVKEFNVYVEGADFEWVAPKPECIWLGTIKLSNEPAKEPVEPTPEPKVEEEVIEVEPTPEEKARIEAFRAGEEALDTKVKCSQCGWEGTYRDTSFGHDDYYCPNCRVESLEVVEEEPEIKPVGELEVVVEGEVREVIKAEEPEPKKEVKDESKKPKPKRSGSKRVASPANAKRAKKLHKKNS